MNNDERHKVFKDRLLRSHEASIATADLLGSMGLESDIKPHTVAEDYDERYNHLDDGDMTVTLPVEVKRLTVNFTGPDDWPYGDIAIVDAAYKFDAKHPKPVAYFCWSDNLETCMVIRTRETRRHWITQTRRDSGVDREYDFYLVPVSLVQFVRACRLPPHELNSGRVETSTDKKRA